MAYRPRYDRPKRLLTFRMMEPIGRVPDLNELPKLQKDQIGQLAARGEHTRRRAADPFDSRGTAVDVADVIKRGVREVVGR